MQNNEYIDHHITHFICSTELEGVFNDNTLLTDLNAVIPTGVIRELNHAGKSRTIVLVTKEEHCLDDLLIKNAYGDLNVEITAIIGNYETLRPLVERFNISFYLIIYLISHESIVEKNMIRT